MKCFVIMPFGKEGTPDHKRNMEIFEKVIKQSVVKTGIVSAQDCVRVDLIDKPGSIVKDIVQGLHQSDIVIADLTGRNPNVSYELGARHILRRGTILLTQSQEDVPFHLRTDRIILYTYPFTTSSLEEEFNRKVEGQIKAIVKNPDAADSPFSEIITSLGKVTPASYLSLDMPIQQTFSSQERHRYTMYLVIHNRGYKKVVGFDWEAYWPAGIPTVSGNSSMTAQEGDPLRPGYIRFRNSAKLGELGPDRKFRALFVEFDVNDASYDSGELKKSVLLRVYANDEPPIEQKFPLEGDGRVNF